ncbi:zinc finger protein 862-like [Apostichopus japonicus]|uniref:zinc finger protein 862-like n=1 Tax=Stichopus japonicus TaxID=307972 RepID=UPI003AB1CA4D
MVDIVNILARLSLLFQKADLSYAQLPKLVKDTVASISKVPTHLGPTLREFRRKVGEDGQFHGIELDGPVMENCVIDSVATRLQECISNRFDVAHNEPQVAAMAKIIDFKLWPIVEEEDFGNEELALLVDYHGIMLQNCGNPGMVEVEWAGIRSSIYNHFKPVHTTTLDQVNNRFREDGPNLLFLVGLLLTIPSHSVECERGFSQMKRIKTDLMNRLSSSTLTSLLRIFLESPRESEFDPFDPYPLLEQQCQTSTPPLSTVIWQQAAAHQWGH